MITTRMYSFLSGVSLARALTISEQDKVHVLPGNIIQTISKPAQPEPEIEPELAQPPKLQYVTRPARRDDKDVGKEDFLPVKIDTDVNGLFFMLFISTSLVESGETDAIVKMVGADIEWLSSLFPLKALEMVSKRTYIFMEDGKPSDTKGAAYRKGGVLLPVPKKAVFRDFKRNYGFMVRINSWADYKSEGSEHTSTLIHELAHTYHYAIQERNARDHDKFLELNSNQKIYNPLTHNKLFGTKAYAQTNEYEMFACLSSALFCPPNGPKEKQNQEFPRNRCELRKCDPDSYHKIISLWNLLNDEGDEGLETKFALEHQQAHESAVDASNAVIAAGLIAAGVCSFCHYRS